MKLSAVRWETAVHSLSFLPHLMYSTSQNSVLSPPDDMVRQETSKSHLRAPSFSVTSVYRAPAPSLCWAGVLRGGCGRGAHRLLQGRGQSCASHEESWGFGAHVRRGVRAAGRATNAELSGEDAGGREQEHRSGICTGPLPCRRPTRCSGSLAARPRAWPMPPSRGAHGWYRPRETTVAHERFAWRGRCSHVSRGHTHSNTGGGLCGSPLLPVTCV